MFDIGLVEELAAVAAALADSDAAPATASERGQAITSLSAIQDTLDGIQTQLLADFDAHRDCAEHGAATTAAWARRELRMTGAEARAGVRAGRTLAALPQVRAAAHAGQIRLAHVMCFTAGITKCGLAVMRQAQDWLLPVAKTCDPDQLKRLIAALADVVHPDDLDNAWARGMDKHDVSLARAGDGYHLTGFLDILTGTQFKTWLEAHSAPTSSQDDRTPPQRRIDALAELITATLAHGLPTDKGIRPQLHASVDLDRLLAMSARHEAGRQDPADTSDATRHAVPSPPAELAGFGPIGDDLLSYLTCTADLTAILTDGTTTGPTPQARVLNVGRTRRLATTSQRHAILARQSGVCANPGCAHTQLEIHHLTWWSHGGRTDLDNLLGLCRRCHILIHQDKLALSPDGHGGFTFSRAHGTPIPDHRRSTAHAVSRRLRELSRPQGQRTAGSGRPAPRPARCRHCGRDPGRAASRRQQPASPGTPTRADLPERSDGLPEQADGPRRV